MNLLVGSLLKTLKNLSHGFALFELMVVVAILSMAAAFFVPRFLKHRIQTKREECRLNLNSVLAAEKTFFAKTGTYTTDLQALNWQPQGVEYQYHFIPTPSSQIQKPGFIFECTGNLDKDATSDTAQIDETGQVIQIIDDTR